MTKLSFDPENTTPCKWCGTPTPSLGTEECDSCHSGRVFIERNPKAAYKMLGMEKGAYTSALQEINNRLSNIECALKINQN